MEKILVVHILDTVLVLVLYFRSIFFIVNIGNLLHTTFASSKSSFQIKGRSVRQEFILQLYLKQRQSTVNTFGSVLIIAHH